MHYTPTPEVPLFQSTRILPSCRDTIPYPNCPSDRWVRLGNLIRNRNIARLGGENRRGKEEETEKMNENKLEDVSVDFFHISLVVIIHEVFQASLFA